MRFLPILIVSALLLSSCHVSPDNSYYTLSSGDTSTYPVKNRGTSLRKVMIPDILDRPQIVMQSGSNGIHILEYNRWAEPFEDMVSRILADDMILQQTGDKKGKAHFVGNREVIVTIDQFIASEDGQVILKATWNDSRKTTLHYRFEQTTTSEPADIHSVVVAMSSLLNELAHAILTSSK